MEEEPQNVGMGIIFVLNKNKNHTFDVKGAVQAVPIRCRRSFFIITDRSGVFVLLGPRSDVFVLLGPRTARFASQTLPLSVAVASRVHQLR